MPKKIPELIVVFDTNALFTSVASDLFQNEIQLLIKSNSSHADLNINWALPKVVVDERRYQMQRRAFELLPSLEKLERLLGHKLNITKEILVERVDNAIQTQMTTFKVKEIPFDTSKVNWNSLIQRSAFRKIPFDAGEKEKGFRDSIIAESFFQLVNSSPSTPAICRLALVTNDSNLSEYVKQELKDSKNIRVLSTISELESLINTLVSTASEEFVSEISEKAERFFFEKGNEGCFFYKEKIRDKISNKYPNELKEIPRIDLVRENGTWVIGPPVFLKKEGKRIFWTSPVHIQAKLYRYEQKLSTSTPIPMYGSGITVSSTGILNTPVSSSTITPYTSSPTITLGGLLSGGAEQISKNYMAEAYSTLFSNSALTKVEAGNGHTRIEINWSVSLAANKRFSSPKIHDIGYSGFKWDNE